MTEPWDVNDGPVFIDTNVIFYAYDKDAESRHQRARELVDAFFQSQRGVISVQVLQELTANLWSKLEVKNPIDSIQKMVRPFFVWDVIEPGTRDVLHANEIKEQYGFSFWDSMILHTAQIAEADWLLSEDLQHNQTIKNLTVVNPFKTQN